MPSRMSLVPQIWCQVTWWRAYNSSKSPAIDDAHSLACSAGSLMAASPEWKKATTFSTVTGSPSDTSTWNSWATTSPSASTVGTSSRRPSPRLTRVRVAMATRIRDCVVSATSSMTSSETCRASRTRRWRSSRPA